MGRREQSGTILIGAAGGAILGVLLALLYGRWRQRRPANAKPITTGQLVRVGAALVPVVRQIVQLFSQLPQEGAPVRGSNESLPDSTAKP